MIGALLVVALYGSIAPQSLGQPLFSGSIRSGSEGRIHLVLQVVTDDARPRNLEPGGEQDVAGYGRQTHCVQQEGGSKLRRSGEDRTRASTWRRLTDANTRLGHRGRGEEQLQPHPDGAAPHACRKPTRSRRSKPSGAAVHALGVSEPTIYAEAGPMSRIRSSSNCPVSTIRTASKGNSLRDGQVATRLVKKDQGGPFTTVESAIQADSGRRCASRTGRTPA